MSNLSRNEGVVLAGLSIYMVLAAMIGYVSVIWFMTGHGPIEVLINGITGQNTTSAYRYGDYAGVVGLLIAIASLELVTKSE